MIAVLLCLIGCSRNPDEALIVGDYRNDDRHIELRVLRDNIFIEKVADREVRGRWQTWIVTVDRAVMQRSRAAVVFVGFIGSRSEEQRNDGQAASWNWNARKLTIQVSEDNKITLVRQGAGGG